jgi:hypothetical protein
MDAAKRILRHLKGCSEKGILFSAHGNLNIEGYTNADWARCLDDQRSTSGYYMFLSGNLISWRSKKQTIVARSTAEAEFRAMASGLCELMWIKVLLIELQLHQSVPLQLYCDNQAAVNIVKESSNFLFLLYIYFTNIMTLISICFKFQIKLFLVNSDNECF